MINAIRALYTPVVRAYQYVPNHDKTSSATKANIKGAVVAVKTSMVMGRRCLRFESLDAVLADAEHLAAVESKQLGNWTLGQILMHLATVYEKSIDGTNFRPGLILRCLGKMLAPLWKRWALRRGIPAGIRPPAFMF
ncbi:MAG: DUF1569 domain-containing protein [Planctomycetota bacterium]|nr:DUF1569 domain-containing protein [Planctomycetota bacterium]